jgi:hypothetical protein
LNRVSDAGCLRKPEPPDVGVDRIFARDEPALAPAQRPAPVAGDRQVGAQFPWPVRAFVAHTDHPTPLVQQAGDVVAHPKCEGRLLLARRGEQIEQVPLRDHRDVAMRHPQPGEVDHRSLAAIGQVQRPSGELGVRQRVELVEQAELVEQSQR